MNSDIMTLHHNEPENFISNPEYFRQYRRLILLEHRVPNNQTSPTQVINAKLDGVSNYQVFTNITIFAYIIPLNCNVKIINGSKSSAKVFGLVIISFQKQTS